MRGAVAFWLCDQAKEYHFISEGRLPQEEQLRFGYVIRLKKIHAFR